jgi:pyruvate formate lyase activating enzyme
METALAEESLSAVLDRMTVPGDLWSSADDRKIRCFACGHRCLVLPGKRGICRVRFNDDGVLKVPFGYVAALQNDPIEKKPFYHFLPGADALTFGLLGCDLHCGYCQNWLTSQALRDPRSGMTPARISARRVVDLALEHGARIVASSYNEPLITAEWAAAIFNIAKARNLKTAFISNGNATPEVLDYIRPFTDAYKIDLKTFNDRRYRFLGAPLKSILNGIETVFARGFWLEVVTLIVPGWNDSEDEIRSAARFLRRMSPDIPWHFTAFHRDYKMWDPQDAEPAHLVRCAETAREEGLRYIYCGNLPGMVGDNENTYCPRCGTLLIQRRGFTVLKNTLSGNTCPLCSAHIPGRFQ